MLPSTAKPFLLSKDAIAPRVCGPITPSTTPWSSNRVGRGAAAQPQPLKRYSRMLACSTSSSCCNHCADNRPIRVRVISRVRAVTPVRLRPARVVPIVRVRSTAIVIAGAAHVVNVLIMAIVAHHLRDLLSHSCLGLRCACGFLCRFAK